MRGTVAPPSAHAKGSRLRTRHTRRSGTSSWAASRSASAAYPDILPPPPRAAASRSTPAPRSSLDQASPLALPAAPPPPSPRPHPRRSQANRYLTPPPSPRPGEQIRELTAGLRRQLGPDCDTSGLPDLAFEAQACYSPLPRCTRAAPALHPCCTCSASTLCPLSRAGRPFRLQARGLRPAHRAWRQQRRRRAAALRARFHGPRRAAAAGATVGLRRRLHAKVLHGLR